MKKLILLVTIIMIGTQIDISAQQRIGQRYSQYNICNIVGITEEQKSEIQKLRIIQMKERQTTQNQLREKRAHLITLQSADKMDMNEINMTIDEITSLQNTQWKKRVMHRNSVRELLTDEQKTFYTNRNGKGQCNGQGNRQCYGQGNREGYGQGNRQGYGQGNRHLMWN